MDFRPTELCKRIALEGQQEVSGGRQLAGHSPLPGTARLGLSAHGQMKSIELLRASNRRPAQERQCAAERRRLRAGFLFWTRTMGDEMGEIVVSLQIKRG